MGWFLDPGSNIIPRGVKLERNTSLFNITSRNSHLGSALTLVPALNDSSFKHPFRHLLDLEFDHLVECLDQRGEGVSLAF